jgi:hypothetical protein
MKFASKNSIPVSRIFKFKNTDQIRQNPSKITQKDFEFFSQKSQSQNSNSKIDKIISLETKSSTKNGRKLGWKS